MNRRPSSPARPPAAFAAALIVLGAAVGLALAAPASLPAGGYAQQLQAAQALEKHAYETHSAADFRAAAQALEACSRQHPEDVKLHSSLGYIYLDKLNEPAKAFPHLKAVYAATPDAPGWGQMYARDAGKLGRIELEIQVLREVIKNNPKDPWSRLDLADALAKARRYGEAEQQYKDALAVAPNEEWVNLRYAQYLKSRGRSAEAEALAKKVLAAHPNSAAALSFIGDIHRANWDLAGAQADYTQARIVDPNYYTAKAGLQEIHHSEAPLLKSTYFAFSGTDHLEQMGLFNMLTVPVANHLFLNASFNNYWFANDRTNFSPVDRTEEGLGLEDRIDHTLSLQGGVSAFQVPGHDIVGFNLGATWKPDNKFWMYGSFRFHDPVNDSVITASKGFTQNLIGLSAGYQFTDDWAASINASHAFYSDGNDRNFIHAETAYTICRAAKVRIGAAYEVIDFRQATPDYSSPPWYQTMGPLIEMEPSITPWLSVHARFELPYVVEASRWGDILAVGPSIHLNDNFQCSAEYLYYYVPGSFVNYSGNGFRVSLSYRF